MARLKVFIHGGGLTSGDAEESFNGNFLGDYGVVAVSMNYRVGPLGFLSVEGDPILTGNLVTKLTNEIEF